MYGLAKIHKENAPLKPIISVVQTYNYKLAKYLDEILKPKVDQTYMLKDTFDFVNRVAEIDHGVDRYMVSFDVESLFTNIPTVETIEIILKLVYTKNTKYFHDLRKNELRELLLIRTTQSHFKFNKSYYEQIDGVAMGSPLGPLFANVFMSNFERKYMKQIKKLGVNLWLRYVDDVFATLKNKEDAEKILEFLNNQHPNIRFTIEHEENHQLPFLDTTVKRCIGKYTTTVYHKKTFTGVYLNWTSLTAKRYKLGLIKCLTKRILRICVDQDDQETELKKLKMLLLKNQYPIDVIETQMKKCLVDPQDKTCDIDQPDQRRKRFITLPYTSRKCEDFATRLRRLVNNTFPSIDLNIAYQAPKTIGEIFSHTRTKWSCQKSTQT